MDFEREQPSGRSSALWEEEGCRARGRPGKRSSSDTERDMAVVDNEDDDTYAEKRLTKHKSVDDEDDSLQKNKVMDLNTTRDYTNS